jgi:pimeloyl-ACP methyl ester carboxylesterase
MQVWEGGAGPPILAVHGLGGSGRYWQGLADRVGDRWSIVAPDLPGFGASDEPDRDIDRAFLLEQLGAIAPQGPLVVIGHSLGGVLAALWAGANPERLRALAVVAAPYPGGEGMDFRSPAELRPSIPRRMLSRGVRSIWPAVAVPVGMARGYPPGIVIDFGRQSVRSRAWTMWSLLSDPEAPSAVADAIRQPSDLPALLAFADDDRTVRRASTDRWRAQLPAARFERIATGGHQFLLRNGFEPVVAWLGERRAEIDDDR